MQPLRSLGAVLAGFLTSFLIGTLVSLLAVQAVHRYYLPLGPAYVVLTTCISLATAFLSGYLMGLIAGRYYLLHALVVTVLLAIMTYFTFPHRYFTTALVTQLLIQHLATLLFRSIGALTAGYQQNNRLAL